MSTSDLTRNSGHHVGVASSIPGRLRVRLHRNSRQEHLINRIKDHLEAQDGIYGVSVNQRTGSVRVDYDHQRHTATDIFGLLRDVDVVVEGLTGAPRVDEQDGVSLNFSEVIEDLNNRVFDIAGVKIDLRNVLPLTFAGAGLWSIAKNGLMIESVPGWFFLWFALDTFIKLHSGDESR